MCRNRFRGITGNLKKSGICYFDFYLTESKRDCQSRIEVAEKLLKLQISEDQKQVLYGNWSTLGIDIKGNELENDYVNKLKELGIVQVDV